MGNAAFLLGYQTYLWSGFWDDEEILPGPAQQAGFRPPINLAAVSHAIIELQKLHGQRAFTPTKVDKITLQHTHFFCRLPAG